MVKECRTVGCNEDDDTRLARSVFDEIEQKRRVRRMETILNLLDR